MEIINSVNLRPKVGSVYSHGWATMKKYFLPLFLILIIVAVIDLPTAFMNDYNHDVNPNISFGNTYKFDFDDHIDVMGEHRNPFSPGMVLLKIFGLAYFLFITNPIGYGARFLRLKAVRNEPFDVKEIFDGFKNYLNVVLATLLTVSIVVIGFIFLIVPGIIFACRLAFVPYLVMDKKLDPVKAVEESWRLTNGYGWRIFGMGVLAFFIGIAGFIVLFFGIIISIMWISASFAAMYHAVMLERGEYATVIDVKENEL